jgi:hypothetical protein
MVFTLVLLNGRYSRHQARGGGGVRPQQRDEVLARVHLAQVIGQVGQQHPGLLGGEARDPLVLPVALGAPSSVMFQRSIGVGFLRTTAIYRLGGNTSGWGSEWGRDLRIRTQAISWPERRRCVPCPITPKPRRA